MAKKKKRIICNIHDEIMIIAEQINNMDIADYRSEATFLRSLRAKVKKIDKLAEEAKERGQAMEDRLYEYFEAIEGLGFTRDKK